MALWARSCGVQCAAGASLVDVLASNPVGCGRRGASSLTELRATGGGDIHNVFDALFPDLTHADIAFLQGAQKTGSLSEGFSVLSEQYFARARAQSLVLHAFIYPLGVFFIGLFLMSLQQVLYDELALGTAASQFGIRAAIVLLGLYFCKRIVSSRPPLLALVLKRIPPFRGLSCALAMQRFTWLLEKSCIAAIPIRESVASAADASGRSAVIRRADLFEREVGGGADFAQSFEQLLGAWPRSLRHSIRIHSPNHLTEWAVPMAAKSRESIELSIHLIGRFSKPLSLILTVPLIFFVMKSLWFTMAAEFSEHVGVFFSY